MGLHRLSGLPTTMEKDIGADRGGGGISTFALTTVMYTTSMSVVNIPWSSVSMVSSQAYQFFFCLIRIIYKVNNTTLSRRAL